MQQSYVTEVNEHGDTITPMTWFSICLLAALSFAAGHEELYQIMRDMGTNKYLLLLVPKLGLANRLRSIADWYAIAISSGRTLLVNWEVSRECNARFSDFFSLHLPNLLFLDQPI